MPDNVIVGKAEIIERCIKRAPIPDQK